MTFKMLHRIIQGVIYIFAGANHFVMPEFYKKIIPPYLPKPEYINWISGAAEILLGALLIVPQTAKRAAWGLVALLVAVFPANWYMFRSNGAGIDVPRWALIARLPLQLVLILFAWWHTRDGKE